MKSLFLSSSLVLALAFTAAVPTESTAHSGAKGIVKERMDAMKEMQRAMKALYAMLSGDQAMDPAAAAGHAGTIRQHSGRAMTILYPPGSLDSPTEALPAVWEDWSGFERSAAELETEAEALLAALANAAGGRGWETEFKRVAASCKSCHQDFRKPK